MRDIAQTYLQLPLRQGVVQKLRGQDNVDRWLKNADFGPRSG